MILRFSRKIAFSSNRPRRMRLLNCSNCDWMVATSKLLCWLGCALLHASCESVIHGTGVSRCPRSFVRNLAYFRKRVKSFGKVVMTGNQYVVDMLVYSV